jgi:hypothetical protein
MGISIFQPPPIPMDKVERGHAVTASGAVEAIDDRVLSEITQLVCQDLRVSASLFSILHQDTQYVVAAQSSPTGAYRRKNSFSGHAIVSGEHLFFVPELLVDERFADDPWVKGDAARSRFYAAAGIRLDGKHAIGAISAIDPYLRSTISLEDREAMAKAASAATARLSQLQFEPRCCG